jgi:hypothetical protein
VPEVALDVHSAAVGLDQPARYSQAKAGPGGVFSLRAGPWPFGAERAFEDTRQVFGDYTLARVGDLDPCLLPFARRSQGYGAICRGMAQGVGDEVVEYAL